MTASPSAQPGEPAASRDPGRLTRRRTLAVTVAALLPLVAMGYLAFPHVFPGRIAGSAYAGSWVFLVLMVLALGVLQLGVLSSYLDLRRELGGIVRASRTPAAVAAAGSVAADLGRELQTLIATRGPDDVGRLLTEIVRILGVLQQQTAQVHEYAGRFEAINEELRSANLRLREMSLTDELTEVGNRRNFEMRIREELNRSTRFGHTFSLLLLDIDAFKRFNDDFGHLQGDAALRALGSLMRSISREGDVPCRIGGEEFAFILPETGKADAMALGERIRRGVEGSIMAPDGSRPLTVSLGLAAFPDDGKTQDDLQRAADEALYQSKREGRNRVTAYSRSPR